VLLDRPLGGQRVTVRFDGALMHVLAEGRLVKTLPAPLTPERRAALRGARPASESLPPPGPAAPTPGTPWQSPQKTPSFASSTTTPNSSPTLDDPAPRSPASRPTPAARNPDTYYRPTCPERAACAEAKPSKIS
jgi:hypothetical protein